MTEIESVLKELRAELGADRVTLRRDLPGDYAFPVTDEALGPGAGSLREERTVDLRTQPVVALLRRGEQVVQHDSRAALLLFAPDGQEALRYEGRDFADRPDTDILLAAVRELGLPARPSPVVVHPHAEPAPSERAYTRERLVPYLRGVRSGALALRSRTGSDDAAALAAMAERYLALLS